MEQAQTAPPLPVQPSANGTHGSMAFSADDSAGAAVTATTAARGESSSNRVSPHQRRLRQRQTAALAPAPLQQNHTPIKGEYRLKRKTLKRLRDPLHISEAQRASMHAAAQLVTKHVRQTQTQHTTSPSLTPRAFNGHDSSSQQQQQRYQTINSTAPLSLPPSRPQPRWNQMLWIGGGTGVTGASQRRKRIVPSWMLLQQQQQNQQAVVRPASSNGRRRHDEPHDAIVVARRQQRRHERVATTATANSNSTMSKSKNDGDLDAWMCGVCGMVFAARPQADDHERQHIAAVVEGMEWNRCSSIMPTISTDTMNNSADIGDATNTGAATTTAPFSSHWNGTTIAEGVFENDDDDDSIFQDQPATAATTAGGGIYSPGSSSGGSHIGGDEALLLSKDIKNHGVLADEALVDVLQRAIPSILTASERDAERELTLLARDKAHYDELSKRAVARRTDPTNRFRSDGEDLLAKVQNKFLDAYQIIKESDGKKGMTDQYQRGSRLKSGSGTAEATQSNVAVLHSARTMYVNVMVKNSVQVVRHELERLAQQRWEVINAAHNSSTTGTTARSPLTRFEQFRVYTQQNVVKLAGIALASDFTPRRIAVQLSNDLYRLMTPRLKRRGVTIETEIEYRVGPYFVLAVNIQTIDWRKLIRATYRDAAQRKAKWIKKESSVRRESDAGSNSDKKAEAHLTFRSILRQSVDNVRGLLNLSLFDMIERSLVLFYSVHYVVYLPLCWAAYYLFFASAMRQFILSTVADEIFYYVEEKGMEMDIKVCRAEAQAAFMLSALREIRADGQELKQKREQESAGGATRDGRNILGPLMGPAIAADQGPAPSPPEGFVVPDNLEFIGLELDLPVGFQRMRWAFLSKRSEFVTEALFKTEAKYENIVMGEWNVFADSIGEPKLPDTINPNDFVGAEKEGEYLMPKSAFVSANTCYETHYLLAYNDYCFCLKKRAKNPDAPFGKTFIAWTQYLVVNTGNNTCRLACSVQPEFPNGEPMVSRQIRSGMRAGTGELFVLLGETVAKYADSFP